MRLMFGLIALLAMTGIASAQQTQPAPQKPPAKPPAQAAKPAAPAGKPGPKSPFTPPAFKITIATEGAFPPFNYLDRKGMPAGFEMELAQEACQRIKAECEFIALKWDQLIPGLIDKKFDIIMSSMEVTRERRQRMGLSRRYYLSPGAFIAAKGAPFDGPPSLLRNKRIGIQRDSMHADWADKSFRRSAQLRRYDSVAQALVALANDEVDAVFGDKAQLWLWSQKPEGKCCELVGQDIKDTQTLGVGVAAGLRKEDVKLREALNKAFGEMMTDGTYKKLSEKYFPFALN
ncbi:transporter substrate-binding domain-containing protein [Reyranella sp. MMS21-HV4-11]|uniref:Transporter substrate-binding domain-containing protein n=1 Tax=Reyranella humidisoli TaxID=2849149 RepID=A0ABS6IHS9_9HYPH|nr:transporter substrate-binding domain-containing protein [Reyranella sp. MMS21-HV4-11]MBU8873317.1 transporter substrate-binding domain-containing protein [Reyranella sp. MMS21-HV4-11]